METSASSLSAEQNVGVAIPSPSDQLTLAREADFFHRRLFRRPASQALIQQYARAHAQLSDLVDASQGEARTVSEVVKRQLDAPSIEPWLRRRSTRHLLTRKLLLISYLAECDGDHPEFTVARSSWVRAIAQLGLAGVTALLRLVLGRWQKARHGLL